MPSRPEIVSRRGFLCAAAGASIGASTFPLLAQLRDSSPLKITKVEPYLVRIGDRTSYPLARVETADGLHGWGEGTTPPSSPAVLTQIRECGKLILNESAWDVEKLWRHMYIVEENTLGGTLFAAISAIDIALWDIIGKKLNVPLYKLLGGKTRDKIRIYTPNARRVCAPDQGTDRPRRHGGKVRPLRSLPRIRSPAFDGHSQRSPRDDHRHPRSRAQFRHLRGMPR
jgi:hypothetical protein